MRRKVQIDSRIINRKLDELLKEPVIIKVNKFNEEAAAELNKDIRTAQESEQSIIPIVIDSYGGYIDALFSMVDIIDACEIPVATIVQGKAMSCGAVLMTCGDEGLRYISPNSRVMIHEASSGEIGKVNEMEVSAKEIRRLNNLLMKIMARNCGWVDNYFLDILHEKNHADWYLTAKQAKSHNLANHIGLPELKINVNVTMELE